MCAHKGLGRCVFFTKLNFQDIINRVSSPDMEYIIIINIGACNCCVHVRPGANKIQIRVLYFPKSVHLLEMPIIIHNYYTRITTPSSICEFVFRWYASYMLLCCLRWWDLTSIATRLEIKCSHYRTVYSPYYL